MIAVAMCDLNFKLDFSKLSNLKLLYENADAGYGQYSNSNNLVPLTYWINAIKCVALSPNGVILTCVHCRCQTAALINLVCLCICMCVKIVKKQMVRKI